MLLTVIAFSPTMPLYMTMTMTVQYIFHQVNDLGPATDEGSVTVGPVVGNAEVELDSVEETPSNVDHGYLGRPCWSAYPSCYYPYDYPHPLYSYCPPDAQGYDDANTADTYSTADGSDVYVPIEEDASALRIPILYLPPPVTDSREVSVYGVERSFSDSEEVAQQNALYAYHYRPAEHLAFATETEWESVPEEEGDYEGGLEEEEYVNESDGSARGEGSATVDSIVGDVEAELDSVEETPSDFDHGYLGRLCWSAYPSCYHPYDYSHPLYSYCPPDAQGYDDANPADTYGTADGSDVHVPIEEDAFAPWTPILYLPPPVIVGRSFSDSEEVAQENALYAYHYSPAEHLAFATETEWESFPEEEVGYEGGSEEGECGC